MPQERQHVVRIGVPAEHLLLEHELAVDVHVENAAGTGHDVHARDLALELLQDPRRQTDGVRPRASGDAVLDADGVLLRHAVDAMRGW